MANGQIKFLTFSTMMDAVWKMRMKQLEECLEQGKSLRMTASACWEEAPMEITSFDIQSYFDNLDPKRTEDMRTLFDMGQRITNEKPAIWGSILGFGKLHYRYPTGTQGFMPALAFASRKQALTVYPSLDVAGYEELKDLGKFTHGKSCLYIKKLSDVRLDVLEAIMTRGYREALGYDFVTPVEY